MSALDEILGPDDSRWPDGTAKVHQCQCGHEGTDPEFESHECMLLSEDVLARDWLDEEWEI